MITYFNDDLILKSSVNGKVDVHSIDVMSDNVSYVTTIQLNFNLEKIIYTKITKNFILIAYYDKDICVLILDYFGSVIKTFDIPKAINILNFFETDNHIYLRCLLKFKSHSKIFDYNLSESKIYNQINIDTDDILAKSNKYIIYLNNKKLYRFDIAHLKKQILSPLFYDSILLISTNFFIYTNKNKLEIYDLTRQKTQILNLSRVNIIQSVKEISQYELLVESMTEGQIVYYTLNLPTMKLIRINNINFTINFIYYNNKISKYICCIENYVNKYEIIYLNSLSDIHSFSLPNKVKIEEYNSNSLYYSKLSQANITNKNKAIIYLHGGPHTRTYNYYNPLISGVLNEGFLVYCLNYFGSSGFGELYQRKIDNAWLTHDIRQITEFIEHLLEINPSVQLSIIGESYGSLLSIYLQKNLGDKFKNIVLLSPIFDLYEFFKFNNSLNFSQNISNNIAKNYHVVTKEIMPFLNSNILIVHGKNDDIIPVSQSENYYSNLNMSNKKNIHLFNNLDDTHYYYSTSTINNIINHIL